MTPGPPIGIGVIGLGDVSAAHVDGYRSLPGEAAVVAVCDSDADVLAEATGRLGVPGHADHRDLLARDDVDAVVILLPHLLHAPVVRAAIEAGKHVTVEKPLAATSAECAELIELAKDRGVVLSVSENSRFVDGYLKIKELLDEGTHGGIRLVRAFIHGSAVAEWHDDRRPWKREPYGFAAILDAATHFFYVLAWMVGPIRSVQAVPRTWAQAHVPGVQVEDGALVSGTLDGGGYFSVEIGLGLELPWGERFEVYADGASIRCDQLSDPPVVVHRGPGDLGTPLASVAADPDGWRTSSIHRGAADFVRALREGRPPLVDPADATAAVLVAEAAYRSVAAGGTVQTV